MQITTKKGYDFFPATSAFQKAIRRSDEETALYFAVEFFNSGYDEYLWRRMKIIMSEDIGLAEPNFPAVIQGLYQSYLEQKKDNKENKPERLFLIHAVILMCRSKKSRLVDWQVIKLWREHDSKDYAIPDYAFDMHNMKGKRMGRGIDHFYEEGSMLKNYVPQEGEEEAKKQAKVLHEQVPGKLKFADLKKGRMTQRDLSFNGTNDE
jgi:replication-associated recombination protein RarA